MAILCALDSVKTVNAYVKGFNLLNITPEEQKEASCKLTPIIEALEKAVDEATRPEKGEGEQIIEIGLEARAVRDVVLALLKQLSKSKRIPNVGKSKPDSEFSSLMFRKIN